MAFKNGMRPVHPGEVLREDFMRPVGLSANALAKALRIPTPRIKIEPMAYVERHAAHA